MPLSPKPSVHPGGYAVKEMRAGAENASFMLASARLSLVHLTQPPRLLSPQRPPLLLLLHGVGSHEGDLLGLAPYLDGRFFIVSARGPVTLGPGMFGWFHVQLDPAQPIINADEAERSRVALVRFIDEAIAAYE